MAIRKRIRQHAGLHEARISSLSHQRPQLRAAPTSSEILVADQPIVGLDLDAMDPVFDRIVLPDRDKTEPLDPRRVTQRPWSGKGVRHLLSQPEGDGYWDFFKPSDHLLISVTDATYRESTWVTVKGSRYFKLRLLLSGELTTARGGTLLRGPQALLVLSPEFSSGGYYIAAGQPTRMIVLHCRPELLTQTLGLVPASLPSPLRSLFSGNSQSSSMLVRFGSEAIRMAQCIVDSRYELPSLFRSPYLESMSVAILCRLLAEMANCEPAHRQSSSLNSRDRNCIYQARDHLSLHFDSPPSIAQLARIVGINQTKLKAGFREAVGTTIFEYVQRLRMERASELLITGDYSVTEVAYQVGYEYPANFTFAFRRFYGQLPRSWKGRGTSHGPQKKNRTPIGDDC